MSERDIAIRAAAKDLFDQVGGRTVMVTPGLGCLTAQGLQEGLTAWHAEDYRKMAERFNHLHGTEDSSLSSVLVPCRCSLMVKFHQFSCRLSFFSTSAACDAFRSMHNVQSSLLWTASAFSYYPSFHIHLKVTDQQPSV